MIEGEIFDMTTETVVDFDHDETHTHGIDHLLRYQSTISHHFSSTRSSFPLSLFPTSLSQNVVAHDKGRKAHLGKSNEGIVPAEIASDAYSRHQPQTDQYGGGTKDGPIDGNEHGTQIPVADGRYDLGFVHCSDDHDLIKQEGRAVRARTVESSLKVVMSLCRNGCGGVLDGRVEMLSGGE